MQSVLMAVLLTIPGKGRIREEIFEDRLKTAGELKKLGGRIHTAGRDAWIIGGGPLTGARVEARDLRGGAALAVAALAASGTTVIATQDLWRGDMKRLMRIWQASAPELK